MLLPRTAVKPVEVDVTMTLPNGQPGTVDGVRFCLVPHGGPTASTVWVDGQFNAGVGRVTLTGRDVEPPAGALGLTRARAELWGLPVVASTTRDPWYIDTIESA